VGDEMSGAKITLFITVALLGLASAANAQSPRPCPPGLNINCDYNGFSFLAVSIEPYGYWSYADGPSANAAIDAAFSECKKHAKLKMCSTKFVPQDPDSAPSGGYMCLAVAKWDPAPNEDQYIRGGIESSYGATSLDAERGAVSDCQRDSDGHSCTIMFSRCASKSYP
jgi:hypothetical protein